MPGQGEPGLGRTGPRIGHRRPGLGRVLGRPLLGELGPGEVAAKDIAAAGDDGEDIAGAHPLADLNPDHGHRAGDAGRHRATLAGDHPADHGDGLVEAHPLDRIDLDERRRLSERRRAENSRKNRYERPAEGGGEAHGRHHTPAKMHIL